ncbi:MAG: formylglycine-generating enzyme family protein [Helicobacteraceae bacterium]|jgi:formylglycine-generating enzyme required for sulfatase activity|nr:formylglycine-generating enzyme family protein [Helicobacteraceae bacterium]
MISARFLVFSRFQRFAAAVLAILALIGCAAKSANQPSDGASETIAAPTPPVKSVTQPSETTNSIGAAFVLIPAGSFKMGCDPNWYNCKDYELPLHEVTISQAFYMGKYEVTQTQWVEIMGANPSEFKGRDNPVESVSWYEVLKFIEKLNDKEPNIIIGGKQYRYALPTEAQWEYAARAGANTRYYWGDQIDDAYAWYKGVSDKTTHPVGQKLPNKWGLYDMAGNVWDMTADWYDKNYYKNSPQNDPKGPLSGKSYASRGGSWYFDAERLRSSERAYGELDGEGDNNVGFRLALVEVEKDEAIKTYKNSIGARFVLIPSGSFTMGCGGDSCQSNASPAHTVTISKAFYIGKYEVTQAQWFEITGDNPSEFKGSDNPVESVSWNDAQAFIKKLNDKEPNIVIGGKQYRYALPTEAQWECAARAGANTNYYFGDKDSRAGDYAWYKGNSDKTTHPVGQKLPNKWGLYDIAGNVYEWTADWKDANYYKESPEIDPKGADSGAERVIRGGRWAAGTDPLRSAYRDSFAPDKSDNDIGFRLALVEVEKEETPSAGAKEPPVTGGGDLGASDALSAIEFVLIPSGSFTMGCGKQCEDNETPAHTVVISKPFYMGKYEVTQAQWQTIMGVNPSRVKGENNPVESVSWNDVREFIQKLNASEPNMVIDGKKYRYALPTEAQWEYAARAGSDTRYYWGDDETKLGDYAWYKDNAQATTHPVGQKLPNRWGLYDTAGNAREWTADWYDENYYKNSPQNDPAGSTREQYRAHRGGGWSNPANLLRSSHRDGYLPNFRSHNIGFRLALIQE